MKPTTRGERLCNPGNIERNAIPWQGMSASQPDTRFVSFDTPAFGIRALGKVLLTYQRKHQLDTVRELINRWAPTNENDTNAYINHVAEQVGVDADEPVDLDEPGILIGLVMAIIRHENGRCVYPDDVIAEGVALAYA